MTSNHPITRLRRWLLRDYPDCKLEFSRYVYKEYGRTESREIFHIFCKDVNRQWLGEQLNHLEDSQELAVHSRIELQDGEVRHIPMIDFTNTRSPATASRRTRYLTQRLGVEIELYQSGNSLHGYYYTLVREEEWYQFLGSLLLCNLPNQIAEDVIDARWVGHSLNHGFSALRWSKHTDQYKQIPTRVLESFSYQDSNDEFTH
jgi:hypothetical protein